jgi:hypothetical protein
MSTALAIRRLGLQRWYERELLRSHSNLVLLVLSAIGLLACAELYRDAATLHDQFKVVAWGAACAGVGVLALRRYLYRLNHAEFVANQAVCKACDTYAKLDILDASGTQVLRVRCRHCAHQWEMNV